MNIILKRVQKRYVAYIDDPKYAHIQYTFNENILYIEHLEVCEKARGKGIGTNLFLYAVHHARRRGIQNIELDSMTQPDDEHNLFLKCGMTYVDKNSGPEMVGAIDDIIL